MVGDIVDIDRSVKYGTANIIWDGAAYLVAWPEPVGKDPCVVHLVGRRIRQSVGTREVIDDVGGGLIAAGNTPFIVDAGCSSEGILGHRLGDAQRHQMSSGVLPQNPVGVASDGAEVAELWLERNKLLVGRASLDGTLLDGFGKLVSPNDLQYSPIASQIVFGGVDYLIVWTENQKVMARLFSRDGAFRGDPLILATMRSYPAAVWTGTEFLVLWTGDEPGGAAITPTGVITPFHPFPAEESVGELALAVSNRGTLVAYASGASDHKTFIKTAMLQGHSFVARSTIAEESSALSQIGLPVVMMPHLASNGTTFLLGWTRQQDIYYSEAMIARLDATGARMTSPLEVADYYIVGKVILPAPLAEAHPQFDGKHYHVYTYGDEGIHGGVLPSGAFDCHCPVDLPRSPWLAYAARAGSGQLVVAEWLEVATPVGPPRRRAAFRLLDFTNVDEPRRRAVR